MSRGGPRRKRHNPEEFTTNWDKIGERQEDDVDRLLIQQNQEHQQELEGFGFDDRKTCPICYDRLIVPGYCEHCNASCSKCGARTKTYRSPGGQFDADKFYNYCPACNAREDRERATSRRQRRIKVAIVVIAVSLTALGMWIFI